MNKPLIALALLAPLSGCISFGAKPPPSLLNLTAAATVPVGEVQRAPGSPTIIINAPAVPQELATLRVPVRANATSIAYLKDALWVEPVNRLFARLLGDTITARTGRVVVGNRQFGAEPGAVMNGDLRNFGVDAGTGDAVVTYDAALTRTGNALEKRRFEARVPASVVAAAPVGVALNEAANKVATDVADWVGK